MGDKGVEPLPKRHGGQCCGKHKALESGTNGVPSGASLAGWGPPKDFSSASPLSVERLLAIQSGSVREEKCVTRGVES